MLLGGLTATEISLVAHLLGITDKFLYANKYHNPLRELDPFLITFPLLIRQGFRVLILGEDVVDLMERIQSPATYWRSRNTGSNFLCPQSPEIWIVAIPSSDIHHSASDEPEKMDNLSLLRQPLESKYMHRTPDASMQAKGMKGTGVFLRTRRPRIASQWSKYMCTVGPCCFELDWDDLYNDIQLSSTLPYIDATEKPHTISFSKVNPAIAFKLDTCNEDQSILLWKKKYSLASNYLFTGRTLDENGRDVLDEVKFSFRFPFRG